MSLSPTPDVSSEEVAVPEPTEISFEELERDVPSGAKFREMPRGVLGYRIFKWLLLLVAVLLALLTLYAYLTYPDLKDIQALAGRDGDAMNAYSQARSDWLSSVKDLGQIFIITPVLPLIGAVLGYIFGRNEQVPGSSNE